MRNKTVQKYGVKYFIQLHTGEWAAENLLKLKNRINVEKMREPAFLAVLTGVNTATYRRDDGVFVIPIGCLGP